VLITGVAGGSPAQRAGLNVGDVIVAVDGRSLVRAEQLAAVASQPGRHLKLQIVRGSTTTSVTVVLSTPRASTD
jgi:S1-C subfamily serine protease